MKEIQLVSNTLWQCIAIIVSVVIIASASTFIALEHNRTQWDIANVESKAKIKASGIMAEAEENSGRSIGRGTCAAGGVSPILC